MSAPGRTCSTWRTSTRSRSISACRRSYLPARAHRAGDRDRRRRLCRHACSTARSTPSTRASTQAGRSVVIRARVANQDQLLRPGLFARVTLILELKRERADRAGAGDLCRAATSQYVYRVVDGKAKQTKVTIGTRRDGRVEIVDGLAAERRRRDRRASEDPRRRRRAGARRGHEERRSQRRADGKGA